MIDKVVYDHGKAIDVLTAELRSLYLTTELMIGKTKEELAINDTGREFIYPILQRQSMLANKNVEYGYDVLDGFYINLDHIKIYKVHSGNEIVLASDGYPILEDTLEKCEAKLKELMLKDCLCMSEYKSTKGIVKGNQSFDDRTYIRFIVS